MFKIRRNGERLNHGTGLVVWHHGGIGFEGLAVGGRHGIHHIKVAGLNIGIGRVGVRVDLERHTVVIHLAIALVVGILDQLDFLVMIPGTELVRAIGNRRLSEGLRILVEGFWQRIESRVTQLDGERGIRLAQVDGELVIVDDLQTFKLLVTLEVVGVLQCVIALDGGEEGGADHAILGVGHVAPSLGEGLGGHIGAVSELPTILELDVVLGGVIIGSNGVGHFILGLAILIERHQSGEHQIDRTTTAGFIGVARNQAILRFGVKCRNDIRPFSRVPRCGRSTAAQRHAKHTGRRRNDKHLAFPHIHYVSLHYFDYRSVSFPRTSST